MAKEWIDWKETDQVRITDLHKTSDLSKHHIHGFVKSIEITDDDRDLRIIKVTDVSNPHAVIAVHMVEKFAVASKFLKVDDEVAIRGHVFMTMKRQLAISCSLSYKVSAVMAIIIRNGKDKVVFYNCDSLIKKHNLNVSAGQKRVETEKDTQVSTVVKKDTQVSAVAKKDTQVSTGSKKPFAIPKMIYSSLRNIYGNKTEECHFYGVVTFHRGPLMSKNKESYITISFLDKTWPEFNKGLQAMIFMEKEKDLPIVKNGDVMRVQYARTMQYKSDHTQIFKSSEKTAKFNCVVFDRSKMNFQKLKTLAERKENTKLISKYSFGDLLRFSSFEQFDFDKNDLEHIEALLEESSLMVLPPDNRPSVVVESTTETEISINQLVDLEEVFRTALAAKKSSSATSTNTTNSTTTTTTTDDSIPAFISSSSSSGTKTSLLCQIFDIISVSQLNSTIRILDGSKVSKNCHVNSEVDVPKEKLGLIGCINYTGSIEAVGFPASAWIMMTNIQMKMKGTGFSLHASNKIGSTFKRVPTSDPAVQKRISNIIAKGISFPCNRRPGLEYINKFCTETLFHHQPVTKIRDILNNTNKCNKYRCTARVASFTPWDVAGFVSESCSDCRMLYPCKEEEDPETDKTDDTKTRKCLACQGTLSFIYFFILTLQDNTGSFEVMVTGKNAVQFLNGQAPCNLRRNKNRLHRIQENVALAFSGRQFLDFCVKSYSVNGQNVFQLFGTKLLLHIRD